MSETAGFGVMVNEVVLLPLATVTPRTVGSMVARKFNDRTVKGLLLFMVDVMMPFTKLLAFLVIASALK